jgi:putative PIG3 family NAD(P)H quinone oxidoreductase
MQAIVIREPGGPDVLTLRDVPIPEAGHGQVRIRVEYAGINRADLLQRAGFYPAPPGVPADIPGLEYAGVIDAVGPGASRHALGARVFGLVAGGAYAEYIVVHEREVAPIPAGLSSEEAAAIPEAFLTAYDAMVVQARLQPGERVLIHAAGSGVGTAGVQIAKALGCFVGGTSRTADKLERARELGLDVGLLARGATFAAAYLDATGGAGADVVLELVGGAYVAEDLRAMAPRGRIVLVGLTAGIQCDLDLGLVLRKRIQITGTVMRARPLEEKIQAAQVLEKNLSPWVAARIVKSVVDRVFPLEEAGAAHAYVVADQSFGKVLLRIGAPIV